LRPDGHGGVDDSDYDADAADGNPVGIGDGDGWMLSVVMMTVKLGDDEDGPGASDKDVVDGVLTMLPYVRTALTIAVRRRHARQILHCDHSRHHGQSHGLVRDVVVLHAAITSGCKASPCGLPSLSQSQRAENASRSTSGTRAAINLSAHVGRSLWELLAVR